MNKLTNSLLSNCVILISTLTLYLIPVLLEDISFSYYFGWVDYFAPADRRADQFAQAWRETSRYFTLTIALTPLFLAGHGLAHLATYSDWKKSIEQKISGSSAKGVFLSLVAFGISITFIFFLPVVEDNGDLAKIAVLYHPSIAPISFSVAVSLMYYSIAALILATFIGSD